MQFRIHFDTQISPGLYNDYCRFLFKRIKREIRERMDPRKYSLREGLVLKSKVMRWRGDSPPKRINLEHYVNNCLRMIKDKGEYVIEINPLSRVWRSKTKVSTLIRLLEYGSESVPPYPLIRTVLRQYSEIYKDLLIEFIKERMLGL